LTALRSHAVDCFVAFAPRNDDRGADACIVIANASEAIEIYKAWLLASASRKSPRIFNLYGSLRQRRAQGMPGAFDSARSLACE